MRGSSQRDAVARAVAGTDVANETSSVSGPTSEELALLTLNMEGTDALSKYLMFV